MTTCLPRAALSVSVGKSAGKANICTCLLRQSAVRTTTCVLWATESAELCPEAAYGGPIFTCPSPLPSHVLAFLQEMPAIWVITQSARATCVAAAVHINGRIHLANRLLRRLQWTTSWTVFKWPNREQHRRGLQVQWAPFQQSIQFNSTLPWRTLANWQVGKTVPIGMPADVCSGSR